jgi:hypothetical protein
MVFTFRVDTPCTYISSIAANSAFLLRWYRCEHFGAKTPLPVLWHTQFNMADSHHQHPVGLAAFPARLRNKPITT